MATGWDDLTGGGGNSGLFQSSDYGTDSKGHRALSNVQQNPGSDVLPMYSGNLGRKAALFGNFRNPVQGQGTFFPMDAEPKELPKSISADGGL